MQGDGSSTEEHGGGGAFSGDLLSLHHWKGNVLSHVVQLIGDAVGSGDVDGGAVILSPPHCERQA